MKDGVASLFGLFSAIPMVSGITEADIDDLTNYTRKYPELLDDAQVASLSTRQFVRYIREKLWDRIATKEYGCTFDKLEKHQQEQVDLLACLAYAKAMEDIQKEKREQEDGKGNKDK